MIFEGGLNGEKETAMKMWRKGVRGRGNSLHSGPEAGLWLACWRSREEAMWLEWSEQRGKSEWGGDGANGSGPCGLWGWAWAFT